MDSCLVLMLNELSSTKRVSYEDFLSNSSSVVPLAAALVAANWKNDEEDEDNDDYEQPEEEEEEEREEQFTKKRRVEEEDEDGQEKPSQEDILFFLEQGEETKCGNDGRIKPFTFRTHPPPICDIEDSTFEEHFGMNKTLMEDYRRGKGFFVPSPKKVLFTVWILCTRESFREVADRFDVSKGGLHYSFVNICLLLKNNSEKFVRWPLVSDQRTTATNLESKYGFPGVVGAVGECVIKNCIKWGSKVASSFVVLQGVCDVSQRFFDTFVSDTMEFRSSRVFVQTPLFSSLCSESFAGSDYHLIGDFGYPLMNNLLVPFENDEFLSQERSEYNRIHDVTYEMVRKAFVRLLGRFKRLDYLHMSRSDLVTTVVQATCCLHNFIVSHEDVESPTEYDPFIDDMQHSAFVSEAVCSKAIEKRDLIASLLFSKQEIEMTVKTT